MACPTCDHTMQTLCAASLWRWCPRCGTIAQFHPGRTDVEAPKLVERCRKFASNFYHLTPDVQLNWNRYGIAEAINKPEDR